MDNINIINITKNFSQNINQITKYETTTDNILRTVIVDDFFTCKNEIMITNLLLHCSEYSSYFSLLNDYEKVFFSQIKNDEIKPKITDNNELYFLFKYDDVKSVSLVEYIYSLNDMNKLILNVFDSFTHILSALIILHQHNICYFNFSPHQIIYLKQYKEKPVLSNFSLSINLLKINHDYLINIINNLHTFSFQPIEIHLLYYFVKFNIQTISYSFIEEFTEKYINNLCILKFLSTEYIEDYKNKCNQLLKQYVNSPKDIIIQNILERNNKWDIYGFSILYLQIFMSISKVYALSNTFINKVIDLLLINISPNSFERKTLKETLDAYNILKNTTSNWEFIETLNNNKLNKFFDTLAT